MRYQLTTGFVVGAVLIPAGTTIDLNRPRQFWGEWERLVEGRSIPSDAIPMDREAVREWKRAYAHAGWLRMPRPSLEWFEENDEVFAEVREAMREQLTKEKVG